MGPPLGSCRLGCDTYIEPLGMRVRSCLGPCVPGYECWPRSMQAPVYDLPIRHTGCESLPKTMPAHGKSLPWTCRLGLETLPRTLRARV